MKNDTKQARIWHILRGPCCRVPARRRPWPAVLRYYAPVEERRSADWPGDMPPRLWATGQFCQWVTCRRGGCPPSVAGRAAQPAPAAPASPAAAAPSCPAPAAARPPAAPASPRAAARTPPAWRPALLLLVLQVLQLLGVFVLLPLQALQQPAMLLLLMGHLLQLPQLPLHQLPPSPLQLHQLRTGRHCNGDPAGRSCWPGTRRHDNPTLEPRASEMSRPLCLSLSVPLSLLRRFHRRCRRHCRCNQW